MIGITLQKLLNPTYLKQKVIGILFIFLTQLSLSVLADTSPVLLDQGTQWTPEARAQFYIQDQGSQLMPLKWFLALKQPNGEAFVANSLNRYGYLPLANRKKYEKDLPIGFTVSNNVVGMTCSACHTRQIDVEGKAYRIDGGPAITDFQHFMADLDVAVAQVLADQTAFDNFARKVLGIFSTKRTRLKLRTDVEQWYEPYHAITKGSLPVQSPWGPTRLDALTLIFNRVSGLDIGTTSSYIIPENIKLADAPTRYPFLWNAAIQDRTQWAGFSDNGNRLLALSRNLGEVIGVFAAFHPVKDDANPLKINYIKTNSANFSGLDNVESLVMKLGPPKWPWPLDNVLVSEGEKIFYKKDARQGNQSCNDCHGVTKSLTHSANGTWATPILDVGTDSKGILLLASKVKTGMLEGAPVLGKPGDVLKSEDYAFTVLKNVVGGAIFQHYTSPSNNKLSVTEQEIKDELLAQSRGESKAPENISHVKSTDHIDATLKVRQAETSGPFKYESRVLQGIWAAAPFLHNGSVPSLNELLKPAAERVAEFRVGPSYDIENIGLAVNQTKFDYVFKTTDCNNRSSGNSRCGHEYGTSFSSSEKRALLEYLKQL